MDKLICIYIFTAVVLVSTANIITITNDDQLHNFTDDLENGDEVNIMSYSYTLNKTITITKSNVNITGFGIFIITWSGNYSTIVPMFEFIDVTNITMSNIVLAGGNSRYDDPHYNEEFQDYTNYMGYDVIGIYINGSGIFDNIQLIGFFHTGEKLLYDGKYGVHGMIISRIDEEIVINKFLFRWIIGHYHGGAILYGQDCEEQPSNPTGVLRLNNPSGVVFSSNELSPEVSCQTHGQPGGNDIYSSGPIIMDNILHKRFNNPEAIEADDVAIVTENLTIIRNLANQYPEIVGFQVVHYGLDHLIFENFNLRNTNVSSDNLFIKNVTLGYVHVTNLTIESSSNYSYANEIIADSIHVNSAYGIIVDHLEFNNLRWTVNQSVVAMFTSSNIGLSSTPNYSVNQTHVIIHNLNISVPVPLDSNPAIPNIPNVPEAEVIAPESSPINYMLIGIIGGTVLLVLVIIVIVVVVIKTRSKKQNKLKSMKSEVSRSESTPSYKDNSSEESPRELDMASMNLIDKTKLKVDGLIGSGGFGEVFFGLYGKQKVAIKYPYGLTAKDKAQFLAECKTLLSIPEQKNIVKVIGYHMDPLMIVTEFMSGGSVDHYVKENKLSESQIVKIGLGIARGMEHLHKCNIIHRDLAARNVLLDDKLNVKISDFGLARLLFSEDGVTQSSGGIPLRWMSPESLNDKSYSKASDVWSYGVVLWEMYMRKMPHDHEPSDIKIAHDIISYGKHPPIDDNLIMNEISDIMRECWTYEPKLRPNFREIIERLSEIKI